MGTWGSGIFEDDEALDFVSDIATSKKATKDTVLHSARRLSKHDGKKYNSICMDIPRVAVAAEMVYASLTGDSRYLPDPSGEAEGLLERLRTRAFAFSAGEVREVIEALGKAIEANDANVCGWRDAKLLQKYTKNLENVRRRLENQFVS